MHTDFNMFINKSLLLIVAVVLVSCGSNKFDIDVNNKVDVKLIRIDSVMFEPDYRDVEANIGSYYTSYPDMFDIYIRRIARVGSYESRNFRDYLRLFLQNPEIRESYDSVKLVFGNFSSQKETIEKAFSYIRHYLPNFKVPAIYTVISGFNESILMTDSAVTVSLDKFLGQHSIFYERVSMPRYMRRRANPELLPFEVVRNWAYTEYDYRDSVYNLATEIVFHGKIMYLMDAAFPTSPDYMKISYTPDDIVWAQKSEKSMWAYMIDKKLLFSTDFREIKKYVDDAPFVATFGEDSPGRIGCWIGWQIVRSYMKNHPDMSISDLINMRDNQQILFESRYYPQ